MTAPLWGVLTRGEMGGLLALVVFIVVVAWLASRRGYGTPPWSSSVAGEPPAPYGNWVGGLLGLVIALIILYIVLRLFDVIVF